MRLDDWFDHARRDAARRGLPALEPLLGMLLEATRALRAADWARDENAVADGDARDDEAADGDAAPFADVSGAPSGARSLGHVAGLPEDGAPPSGPTPPARGESR